MALSRRSPDIGLAPIDVLCIAKVDVFKAETHEIIHDSPVIN